MHILHTVHHILLKVLTRWICLTIKSFFSWWSYPLYSCDLQVWFRGGIAGDIRFLFKFGTVISCLILIHELQLQIEKLSSLIIALLIFLYIAFNLGEWEWNVQKNFVFKAIGFYQLCWQYKVATVKSFNAEFLLKLFIRANSNLRNYIPLFCV